MLSFDSPILALDASSTRADVALLHGAHLLASDTVRMGAGTTDALFPAVARLAAHVGGLAALSAIVCGGGPGSFTSLRIAGALVKGLAHGLQRPLYVVPSLLAAATDIPEALPLGEGIIHADALRGERYVQRFIRQPNGDVCASGPLERRSVVELRETTEEASRIAVGAPVPELPSAACVWPRMDRLSRIGGAWCEAPVMLATWEPAYGRLAEAQVKWEDQHRQQLPDRGVTWASGGVA